MSEAEERRWLQGRYDWEDERWQDHCGDPECEHCTGYIEQHDNARAAALRARASISGERGDG